MEENNNYEEKQEQSTTEENRQPNTTKNGYNPEKFDPKSVSIEQYLYDNNSILYNIEANMNILIHRVTYLIQMLEEKEKENKKKQSSKMNARVMGQTY